LKKTTIKTAPYANASFIIGIFALALSIFPIFGGSLIAISFMVVFFITPIFAISLGTLSVIFAFLSKKKLDQAWNKTDQTLEKLGGRWKVVVGMILGFISILVGGFIAAVFFYFTQEMKATPTEPVGESQMYFYGDEEYNEVAIQTILLPDNTLLTKGHRYIRHLTGSASQVLLKTDLNGKEIWTKTYEGSGGKVILASDETILLAYVIDDSVSTSGKKVEILKLSLDGDRLDSFEFDFAYEPKGIQVFKVVGQDLYILGASLISFEEDSGALTLIMKIDSQGKPLWSMMYEQEITGNLQDISVVDDGFVTTGWVEVDPVSKYEFYYNHLDWQGKRISAPRDEDPLNFQVIETHVEKDGTIAVLGNQMNEEGILNGILMKMKPNGEIIWSKPVSRNGYHFLTGFIPWKDGWLVSGWTPRKTSLMTLKSQKVESWDTWYIGIINAEGELMHGFNGEKESFAAWEVTAISKDRCVLTGFGGDKATMGDYAADDIGLLFYK